jgi:hypothetical protein
VGYSTGTFVGAAGVAYLLLSTTISTLGALEHPQDTLSHHATPTHLACKGVPAFLSDPPWTLAKRDEAVQRGPYKSAAITFSQFLHEDMFDYVQMGYWIVLPYSVVRTLPNL